MVGPQARREAVKAFQTATECSERHACGQLEVLRAMVRYRQRPTRFSAANERLRIRLRELAEQRRRWKTGDRRDRRDVPPAGGPGNSGELGELGDRRDVPGPGGEELSMLGPFWSTAI